MAEKLNPQEWEGHTEGPWRGPSEPLDSVPYLHCYTPDGKGPFHSSRPFAEKMANAALQRAAPSLAARVEELEAENERLRDLLKRLAKGDSPKRRAMILAALEQNQ